MTTVKTIKAFPASHLPGGIVLINKPINRRFDEDLTLGLQGTVMAKVLGLVAALAVFSAWMRVVGNPHVVETVIGLVLAVIAGIWVFVQARKFGAPPK